MRTGYLLLGLVGLYLFATVVLVALGAEAGQIALLLAPAAGAIGVIIKTTNDVTAKLDDIGRKVNGGLEAAKVEAHQAGFGAGWIAADAAAARKGPSQ